MALRAGERGWKGRQREVHESQIFFFFLIILLLEGFLEVRERVGFEKLTV